MSDTPLTYLEAAMLLEQLGPGPVEVDRAPASYGMIHTVFITKPPPMPSVFKTVLPGKRDLFEAEVVELAGILHQVMRLSPGTHIDTRPYRDGGCIKIDGSMGYVWMHDNEATCVGWLGRMPNGDLYRHWALLVPVT